MMSAFKRTYSVLENAYRLAIYNNGEFSEWGFTNSAPHDAQLVYEMLKPHLKISKNCGNKVGVDVFQFRLDEKYLTTYSDRADIDIDPGYTNPWRCATWVMANENFDYLHCDDLSWNGKTKCK
jgi:hypothetical protein